MQIKSDSEFTVGTETESSACFNIISICQDTAAERRARQVQSSLAARLGGEMEFEHVSWSTLALGAERMREVAATQAAEAGLVILSLRGDGPFPPVVRDWFRRWVPHRGGAPGALVALFDTESEATGVPAVLRRQLNDLARLAGMEFFSTSLPRSAGARVAHAAPAQEAARHGRSATLLFSPSVTRWGICE